MNTLGTRIKALRQAENITQETLALHLCVTPQAVSRWENEASMPDITMLPALAYFFGVTIDELLQYTPEDTEEEVAQIEQEYYRYMDGNPERAEAILRRGLRKYPGNEVLQMDLLYLLRGEERYQERMALCRRLLKSRDDAVRFRARSVLAKTYRCQGHMELAKETLAELPYFQETKLELQAKLLGGAEGLLAAQREKMGSLARLLDMLECIAKHHEEETDKEKAETMRRIAKKALEAFREDLPYQFPGREAAVQTYEVFSAERNM